MNEPQIAENIEAKRTYCQPPIPRIPDRHYVSELVRESENLGLSWSFCINALVEEWDVNYLEALRLVRTAVNELPATRI